MDWVAGRLGGGLTFSLRPNAAYLRGGGVKGMDEINFITLTHQQQNDGGGGWVDAGENISRREARTKHIFGVVVKRVWMDVAMRPRPRGAHMQRCFS